MVYMGKRIIVFGGSFSPPTLAHEAIIRECLELPGYDELWLLPSGNRTDKNIAVTHSHQLAMLSLLKQVVFTDEPRIRIDEREVRRTIATETDDSYRELREQNPGVDFQFVYGADSYATIRLWQNGTYLANHLPVLIVPRPGSDMPAESAHVHHLKPLSPLIENISSTAVRNALQAGQNVDASVPAAIAGYLDTHNLFVE
jgi:nicotinate-nucleotide adenylyltransferase